MAPAMSEVREVYNETKLATAKVASATAHQIVKNAETKAQWRTRRTSIAKMEKDVIGKMSRLICENKDKIWSSFWMKDVKKQGRLTSSEIKSGMIQHTSSSLVPVVMYHFFPLIRVFHCLVENV